MGNIGKHWETLWILGNFVERMATLCDIVEGFPLCYTQLSGVSWQRFKKGKQKRKSETISDKNTNTRKLEKKNFEKHLEKLRNIGDEHWGTLCNFLKHIYCAILMDISEHSKTNRNIGKH